MRDRDRKTAEYFGFLSRVTAFEQSVIELDGIEGEQIDFDLDGWWSNIRQIILVPRYNIPMQDQQYFAKRSAMIRSVIETAAKFGLSRTGDSVEDYGNHLYFVFQCDHTWPKASV